MKKSTISIRWHDRGNPEMVECWNFSIGDGLLRFQVDDDDEPMVWRFVPLRSMREFTVTDRRR